MPIKGILQRLLENHADFVVVGGLAATLYGASTVTYDVDLCFDFSPQNIRRLREALRNLHPRVRAQTKWVSLEELPLEQLSSLGNLYLQTDYGGLDLLSSVSEIGNYLKVKEQSAELSVFNQPCRVLNLEALIRVKEGMGRPKDHQVALELKTILEKRSRCGSVS